MNVKNVQKPLEKLWDILSKQHGMLFTFDLAKYGNQELTFRSWKQAVKSKRFLEQFIRLQMR